jgi:hypothetical protein
MANIYTNFKLWLRGLLSAHDVSPENVKDEVDGLFEETVQYIKASADAMASTTTAADYFFSAFRDFQIVDAKFVSAGTATANDTNYGTIIVNKHDGAGGAATVAASVATQTTGSGGGGSIAAGVPYNLALSATVANTQLSAGNVLSFQITKTGSGVVIPAGWVKLTLRSL